MAILHLVRQSPFSTTILDDCLTLLQPADGVVFIDDGCYSLNHQKLSAFTEKVAQNVFVIEHHYRARGLSIPDNIKQISMNDFVNLSLKFDKTLTWQ